MQQGSSLSFVVPAFAILNLPEFDCPVGFNDPDHDSTEEERTELWQVYRIWAQAHQNKSMRQSSADKVKKLIKNP